MRPGPKIKANSVQQVGRTSIAVDRFTRDALAQQAADHNTTIGLYLRGLAKSQGGLIATLLPGGVMAEKVEISQNEVAKRLSLIESLLKPFIGENTAPVVRHGMQLAMADLNVRQRLETVLAGYVGITIDKEKLLNDILQELPSKELLKES